MSKNLRIKTNMNSSEELWFQLRFKNNYAFKSSNTVKRALELLEARKLPNPSRIDYIKEDKVQTYEITSFTERIILDIIANNLNEDYEVIIDNNLYKSHMSVYINQTYSSVYGYTIPFSFLLDWKSTDFFFLFRETLKLFPDTYMGVCNFRIVENQIIENNLNGDTRTFYLPALHWLQYLGQEELYRQGGIEAFESNPLLKTERIHDGLLIQVGESPYDAFTPEGEQLLVEATRSLPPVRIIS
jgi:hypothetical protein